MRIHQKLIADLTMTYAPADSAKAGGQSQRHVAETVTFTLNDGVDEGTFIKAAQGTEAFVSAAPGYISRHLSRGENGTWTDHVLWSDMASAMDAAKAVMSEPSFGPFMGAINPDSVTMRHETVVWSMGR